ncbi:MAG: hypothetical protein GW867_25855 [Armatimonadetes bacterium]|nr:hypothetical protein [Armatimonadota bacterium]
MTVFPYRASPGRPRQKRPTATVTIGYRRRHTIERMLIDSGADVSLLPRAVGAALGRSVDPDEQLSYLRGAGGGRVPVVYRRVRLLIGDHWMRAPVGWVQDGSPLLILGRRGVFPQFAVEFRQFEWVTIFRHVSELP